jgi:hypothetical protein
MTDENSVPIPLDKPERTPADVTTEDPASTSGNGSAET